MLVAVVSFVAEQLGLMLPTISWGYNLSRTAGELVLFQPLKFLIENAGDVTATVLLLLAFGWSFLRSRVVRLILLRSAKFNDSRPLSVATIRS